MPSLVITGTIGSGKSFLLKELNRHLSERGAQVESFSADEQNRRILEEDEEVRNEVASQLGKEFLDSQGRPDRNKLSTLITRDQNARKILEGIMHPRLESQWRPQAEQYRGKKSSFFVAEIPLLYEKGLSAYFDTVLVIGCSDDIRKSRLQTNRSISDELANHWISIQQSQNQKISLSDHLFWNDGSQNSLSLQLCQLLRYLSIP